VTIAAFQRSLGVTLRHATDDDIPDLQRLIEQLARALSVGYYTPPQIDAAMCYVFGVDSRADGAIDRASAARPITVSVYDEPAGRCVMTDDSEQVAAVLFTVNVARVAAFYEHVIGMQVRKSAAGHVSLKKSRFLLTVHAIPDQYAKQIIVTTPPAVRETSAIKLSFRVAGITEAREMAARCGGCVYPADREWRDGQKTLCDGCDPDGNVFQVFTVTEPQT